jgi:SOS response regulatory protein OraA/RecX
MITIQTIAQRDRTEEELMAWLEAKSLQEFRQFMASPWVASLFSPETIEQLYQKLQQQQEEAPLEVGQD